MIAVLGAGSWGTALAIVLARANIDQSIFLWGRDKKILDNINTYHSNEKYLPKIKLPVNIYGCKDLKQLMQQANDLLIAVPSHAFLHVLDSIYPYFTAQHRIVFATKGLNSVNGSFLDQLILTKFAKFNQCLPCAVLSGPSFALEVAKGLPTAVAVASNDKKFAKDILKYFHSSLFRIYINDDMLGVQLGGIVKNIIAVATGISDGLGFGANARAALITRGSAEIRRLAKAIGAKMETLLGLSGIGDLVLTCTDNQSRNRRFGLALASGKTCQEALDTVGQAVEARYNTKQILKLAKINKIEMPITEQVDAILSEKITPLDAFNKLITRMPKTE